MTAQHFEGFDAEPEAESRSQRKREAQALRRLIEDICALGEQSFRALRLQDDVREALLEARRLRPRSDERRRQLQYAARLQRAYPDDDLGARVRRLGASAKSDPLTLKLEKVRLALVTGGKPALDAFCALIVDTDRSKLRTLVKKAAAEAGAPDQAPKPHSRALYRYLKSEFARSGAEVPLKLL